MPDSKRKLFTSDDFDKHINVGDELTFDKPFLKRLRVDLTWAGTDLDLCAFLVDKNSLMNDRADLVYYGSKLRWKPARAFDDPNFDALEGAFSTWPAEGFKNPNRWMEATLPISDDGSVIGSWDDIGDENDEKTDANGNPLRGEQMHILLDNVDVRKHKAIIIAAAVAKARIALGETFADAHNPILSISNEDTNEEIVSYALASQFPGKDAICIARLEFDDDSFLWTFVPTEDSFTGGMEYLARMVFN